MLLRILPDGDPVIPSCHRTARQRRLPANKAAPVAPSSCRKLERPILPSGTCLKVSDTRIIVRHHSWIQSWNCLEVRVLLKYGWTWPSSIIIPKRTAQQAVENAATSATPRYIHHDPTASHTFGLMDHKQFLASVVSMRAFWGLHWGFFGAVNGHRSLGLWDIRSSIQSTKSNQ